MRTWRRHHGGDQAGRGNTRRHLLRAAGGGTVLWALGACGLTESEPDPPPPPDPLLPLLTATRELAGDYARAVATHPDLSARLTPLLAAHQAHVTELAKLIGEPSAGASEAATTAGAVTADTKATVAALRSAEQVATKAAASACGQAPAERATLLGTIAAARATHVEVLR